jgi:hypothetical protein
MGAQARTGRVYHQFGDAASNGEERFPNRTLSLSPPLEVDADDALYHVDRILLHKGSAQASAGSTFAGKDMVLTTIRGSPKPTCYPERNVTSAVLSIFRP